MATDISQSSHSPASMTFRLWHLFLLMSAVAAWCTVLRSSPNLTLVLGVSIVPGMVSLIIASRVRYRRVADLSIFRACLLLLAASGIWFGIYILSIGPVIALVESVNVGRDAARAFYDPVIWLHGNTILEGPLEWYSNVWGWQ